MTEEKLKELTETADRMILPFFPKETGMQKRLFESMNYSFDAGGKRIRPIMLMESYLMLGGNEDEIEHLAPFMAAIEMVHTASLIHDDLPAVDNDDFRRGKPTNHVIYGECTATLAGDALQAEAFRTILSSSLPAEVRAECARLLSNAAGIEGICGGQQLDMEGESKILNREELLEIHKRKTASMLVAACRMGIACGQGSAAQIDAANRYAEAMGLAFQIRDDMLDQISTEEELGKPIGSDEQEQKTTFMSLYGLERCEQEVHALTEQAIKAVHGMFDNADFLQSLARSMEVRRS